MKAHIFDITRNSYVDGPGIRTTVFFKGCNLRCAWCHNPESQNFASEMLFYRDKCTGCGKCRAVCPHGGQECDLCGKCTWLCPASAREICGKEYTPDEVLRIVRKDCAFYESSGGGVTFSGGECMLQTEFLCEILKMCKENGIHTAIDTAGNVPYERFAEVIPYTDLFLYDIKCMDPQLHRKYTGVSNERILDNLQKLLGEGKKVWIRIPVIAGVNDSLKEMRDIREFLQKSGTVEKIELLPYHAMGEHKYSALGKESPIFEVPSPERMEELREIFR